jgi:hypothetical protein
VTSGRSWVFWARGSLLCALAGHWLANVVFDDDQYSRAALEYSWRASVPLLIQTIAIVGIVLSLGRVAASLASGLPRPGRSGIRTPRLLALVMASQVVLFVLLEVSERIYQREPFTAGLLAEGFSAELIIAVGLSALLIVLGHAAIRAIRSLRRHPIPPVLQDRLGAIGHEAPPVHALIVVGDVRAPPVLGT